MSASIAAWSSRTGISPRCLSQQLMRSFHWISTDRYDPGISRRNVSLVTPKQRLLEGLWNRFCKSKCRYLPKPATSRPRPELKCAAVARTGRCWMWTGHLPPFSIQGRSWAPSRLLGVISPAERGQRSNSPARTKFLQSILSNMGDAVVVADKEENFLVFNPATDRGKIPGMVTAVWSISAG